MKCCLLQILYVLLLSIGKNKGLSDEFILEQLEQHSQRIRRLEEFCIQSDTGAGIDSNADDLSREFGAGKVVKVGKFDFQCTLYQ